MAKYWAQLSDGYLSLEFEQVGQLLTIQNPSGTFYASGNGINFDEFFRINIGRRSTCCIYKTEIPECVLRSQSSITGYDNNIIYDKCHITELKIEELILQTISFTNSIIKEITIERCRREGIRTIHIGRESEVLQLKIIDSRIGQFHVTDAKSIGSIQIKTGTPESILIKNTKFNTLECDFFGEIRKIEINNCQFVSAKFYNLTIRQEFYLTKCCEGHVYFNLCEIKSDEFCITDSTLNVIMYKLRSYNKIIFRINESSLSKLLLERCYFADEVLFQGKMAQREKNLIIKDTVFKELVLFDDDNAKCIENYETLFQKGLLLPIPKDIDTESIHSTVWCILKKQALSRNDNINAFHYRKNELNSYINQLKNKGLFSQEGIVLILNKYSNNHGISWLRGIVFTLLSWIVFYSLFVLASDNFYCITHKDCRFALFDSKFLANAIDYLWIPQGLKDLSTGLNNNHIWWISILMVIIFILGKILIAYGVFQTISAFRRHGKM